MLATWSALVVPDFTALPVRRYGIRYRLTVSCPMCRETKQLQSPIWSLLEQYLPGRENVSRSIGRRTIKFTLVLRHAETNQVSSEIDWYVIGSSGYLGRNLLEQTWPCGQCGLCFGLTASEKERLKLEMAQSITIGWVEAEILRLEPNLPGWEQHQGRRSWRLMPARKMLTTGS